MPATTRTFVAIEVPGDRAGRLERLQALLAPEAPGVHWVGSGHFHATLAFLGDVPDADLARVCRAVAEVSAGRAPLELTLEGLGAFPDPRRPRTVWVGLTGPGLEPLAALHRELGLALTRIGYRPDAERFTPHVTLGRIKARRRAPPPPDLTALVRHYRGWSAGPMTIAEVITFASALKPEGSVYTPLARAALRGEKPSSVP